MSIQKKSLISTLKTAKKANVASTHDVDTKGSKVASMRMPTSLSAASTDASAMTFLRIGLHAVLVALPT